MAMSTEQSYVPEPPVILQSRVKEKAEPKLKQLKKTIGAESYMFLTRDGIAMCHEVSEDTHVETAAIMYGTLYGGSITAQSELRKKPTENILIDAEDGPTLVTGIVDKYVLAVALGKNMSFTPEIRKEISKSVNDLSDIIQNR